MKKGFKANNSSIQSESISRITKSDIKYMVNESIKRLTEGYNNEFTIQDIADNPKKYHAPKFFRRFAFGEINGTITASAQPDKCGVTHPVENRRYSVRECARIQSFPDNYTFGAIPLQSRYKVIGNAVPPVLGWVLATALLNILPDNN